MLRAMFMARTRRAGATAGAVNATCVTGWVMVMVGAGAGAAADVVAGITAAMLAAAAAVATIAARAARAGRSLGTQWSSV